jgi:hypothetical protein
MKFRRTTAKTLTKDLIALVEFLKSDNSNGVLLKTMSTEFNVWMDILHDEDVFGTEGQLDPRGDHRG